LCASSWAVLVGLGLAGGPHAGHVHAPRTLGYGSEVLHWSLMVLAMMLPFHLETIRETAEISLWRRRNRAIASVLGGFAVPWLGLGLVVAALRSSPLAHQREAASGAFVLAACWLFTRPYAYSLAACHRQMPLAAKGWPAYRDALCFGAVRGAACVGTCWPLMVACTFAGHSLVALGGGYMISQAERGAFRPRRRVSFLLTLGLAAWSLAAAQPLPEGHLMGATSKAFSLSPRTEELRIPIDAPTPGGRFVLRMESLKATELPPAYAVYLNLPRGVNPKKRPDLRVGVLAMYGIMEATAARRPAPADGLTFQFDVTTVIGQLAKEGGGPVRVLRVAFVPNHTKGATRVTVGRVALVHYRDPRREGSPERPQ
jgi:hypothetical protein